MSILEKFGLWMSAVVIVLMLFLITFSQNGLLDYHRLKKKYNSLTDQIFHVEKDNKKIEEEIRRLQNDAEYIRHLAKHEHEMAEKEELIFKTVSPDSGKKTDKKTAHTQESTAP